MTNTPDHHDRAYGIAPPGWRLPDASRVGGVCLLVSDLPRSLDYYQQVIGLAVHSSDPKEAVLGPHGDDRPLLTLRTRSGVTRARRGAFGLYHFALLLPDRSDLGRFLAHVSALGLHVGMADHLVSEALYLWDPDGLGIEVYADRPRSTWQVRGRELAMTTDPLDERSVVAAGGGAAWTGCPAGTTVGHVHLHVGSLEAAEAFYHRAVGFDKIVWSYPGALFLSAGGYHHHLGTNVWSRGPSPPADSAQLLEWEIVVPSAADAAAPRDSLRSAGYAVDEAGTGFLVADPWGTRLRIRAHTPDERRPARNTLDS
ncbi:MAG TPA: VOC family protein [Vicinamibacterales bacterium]|nr:VOC family protein [Vicinamibacterales bacterium]